VPTLYFGDGVFSRLELMKVFNRAVVGAFAGGVAGALLGASTMFAVDALIPRTATADTHYLQGVASTAEMPLAIVRQ